MNGMPDLIVVVSITVNEAFETMLNPSLSYIGADYLLIKTDPNLSLSESYNSILTTHKDEVEKSKAIAFIFQNVKILDENWGKKILDLLQTLPNMGYGGLECVNCKNKSIGFDGNYVDERVDGSTILECGTCDADFIVIPTSLFLERQFDVQFPWYPLAEDYQCWVRWIKEMNVYVLPLRMVWTDYFGKTKFTSQFKNHHEYRVVLWKEHVKLLEKWKRGPIPSTTWRAGA